MNLPQNKIENLNQLIQISLNSTHDPITKALEIARMSGAFKQGNIVFVHKQLYPISSHNPQQSLQQLKAFKLKAA